MIRGRIIIIREMLKSIATIDQARMIFDSFRVDLVETGMDQSLRQAQGEESSAQFRAESINYAALLLLCSNYPII